jgi:hypothetical protein
MMNEEPLLLGTNNCNENLSLFIFFVQHRLLKGLLCTHKFGNHIKLLAREGLIGVKLTNSFNCFKYIPSLSLRVNSDCDFRLLPVVSKASAAADSVTPKA